MQAVWPRLCEVVVFVLQLSLQITTNHWLSAGLKAEVSVRGLTLLITVLQVYDLLQPIAVGEQ